MAPIHASVTFWPVFHISTSSTRSWNQNIGPLFPANLRKCVVVVGILNGSRVLKRFASVPDFPFTFRELRGVGDGKDIPEARIAEGMLKGCFVGVGGVCRGEDGETIPWSDFGGATATLVPCRVPREEGSTSSRDAYEGMSMASMSVHGTWCLSYKKQP